MNKATEIIQQIDELENELYLHYEEFMKKEEIMEGLRDKYTDFIDLKYFDFRRDDLKNIAISAMNQLNGNQIRDMFEELENRLVDYDELMRNKKELEERIEKFKEESKNKKENGESQT